MGALASHSCFASCPPGLEPLTAAELAKLGVTLGGRETGGVSFAATAAQLYTANLELRTASRVLVRMAEFPARAFYELERKAKRVPWEDIIRPGTLVSFRVTSRKSKLYHQDAIAERLTAASGGISATGTRDLECGPAPLATAPAPADEDDAEGSAAVPGAQLFVVRVIRDLVTISADSSGEHLHRRGYRLATAKAPVRENLAAAILLAAGYDGSVPLLDPFCGSGTIPIEAALIAQCLAPGLHRRFAFEQWPSFDAVVWEALRRSALARGLPRAPAAICGTDRDAGAIAAARANAGRAGVGENAVFAQTPLEALVPPVGPGLVASNPPYGVRVGDRSEAETLAASFRTFIREHCPRWQVALLTAEGGADFAGRLNLPPGLRTTNGGLAVRLAIGPR